MELIINSPEAVVYEAVDLAVYPYPFVGRPASVRLGKQISVVDPGAAIVGRRTADAQSAARYVDACEAATAASTASGTTGASRASAGRAAGACGNTLIGDRVYRWNSYIQEIYIAQIGSYGVTYVRNIASVISKHSVNIPVLNACRHLDTYIERLFEAVKHTGSRPCKSRGYGAVHASRKC